MKERDEDQSSKTEEPTQKKIEDARASGNIPISRELVNFCLFLMFTIMLVFLAPKICKKFLEFAVFFLTSIHSIDTTGNGIMILAEKIIYFILALVTTPLLIGAVIIVLTYIMQQGGFIFTVKAVSPDLSKISIFKGIERLFSMRSIAELIKGVLKLIIVTTCAYFAINSSFREIQFAFLLDIIDVLKLTLKLAIAMMIAICSIMFIIAAIDFLYTKIEHSNKLMMSMKEIKDEHKQLEGNPEIKAKLQSKRKSLLKKFVAKNVAKADVVITNPTHYAIALEYDPKVDPAPKVIAKGADLLAAKIREIAEQNFIPIIQNPPLARALFDATEVDELIPIEYYKAVAEIISYVMKIRPGTKLAKGVAQDRNKK